MKKVKILGKSIPVFVLVLLGIGLVSATLLTYFGQIVTTANVQQSITVDGQVGQAALTHTVNAVAGEEVCFLHKVKNYASVPVPVTFATTLSPPDGGVVTTLYDITADKTTLTFCEKDISTWHCKTGNTATLTFDTVSPTFKGTLTTSGLVDATNYVLVYYKDLDPRFNTWNQPNKVYKIATFTGADAKTGLAINADLGVNLPYIDDWNINPVPDYCLNHNTFDSYAHCKGAKLWIITQADYNDADKKLISWNPTAWLFETDLITYSDCDLLAGPEYQFYATTGTAITSIPAETTTPVLVCYDFKLLAYDAYTITTNVVPT